MCLRVCVCFVIQGAKTSNFTLLRITVLYVLPSCVAVHRLIYSLPYFSVHLILK